MPIVPVNPGIGIFFTRFNKQLNMIISTFNNKISRQDAEELKELIFLQITNQT